LRWRFKPATKTIATSGPIVAPDGSIYYTLAGVTRNRIALTPISPPKIVAGLRFIEFYSPL